MKKSSSINNYNQDKIKDYHRSPIVRNKSLKDLSKNPNIYKNECRKDNDNESRKYNNGYDNPISSRNNYNMKRKNNSQNYGIQHPLKINRNLSATNYFDNKYPSDKISSPLNKNKKNENNKKRRNSSMKNNGDDKVQQYFYKLICNNCYNNKKATKNLQKQPLERKEILNKTFNKMNPFYFKDKMDDMHKDKINNKIKELEKLQKQALYNLTKYQKENPTNVEKLQKKNEYSINPLNSQQNEDPRIMKVQKQYDNKENFINQNKDLYQIDKPRKAIRDYFNKCLFKVPVIEEEYHVDPEYKKEYTKQLKKQIEENKNNKKKKKAEEIKEEKVANKEMNDYIEFLKKKDKEDKQKQREEFNKNNKIIDEMKKKNEEEEKKKDRKYGEELRKQIKEENYKINEKKRQKKLNEIDKFQKWLGNFEKRKNNKKKEKEDENNKWKNYAEEYNIKCKHGLDIYRCTICNKVFDKENLIKYFYSPSTNSSATFSKRTSFVK